MSEDEESEEESEEEEKQHQINKNKINQYNNYYDEFYKICNTIYTFNYNSDKFYELLDTYNEEDKLVKRGGIFEILIKFIYSFNNDTDVVYLNHEIPHDLKKKLMIPWQDNGIDILVKLKNMEYIPIQAKFRKGKNVISFKELSTFITQVEFISVIFKKCVIITNVYELSNIHKQLVHNINNKLLRPNSVELKTIYGNDFNNMLKNFFENIKNRIITQKGLKQIQTNTIYTESNIKKLKKLSIFNKLNKKTDYPVVVKNELGENIVIYYARDNFIRDRFINSEKFQNALLNGWKFNEIEPTTNEIEPTIRICSGIFENTGKKCTFKVKGGKNSEYCKKHKSQAKNCL